MSDFDLDWGMEHELHVDHDGGVDHGLADAHIYEGHDQHDTYADATHEGDAGHDLHHLHEDTHHDPQDGPDYTAEAGLDPVDAHHEDPLTLDEQDIDLPDWQLDTSFLDGHYDLVGAAPDENDMWSQFMTDMHEEVNPYAAG
ncbi:hypothetical protein ACQP2P_05435 [Dactylosporangium sp. CA-139114]|uniref:hypothetical protein n=1 Tax=Dactylosporangium sp. CA-139114 TaxID=3239931 RepID=UPI003D97B443